jgi:hypothetical protein
LFIFRFSTRCGVGWPDLGIRERKRGGVVVPSSSSPAESGYLLPRLNNPNLHQALQTISQTSKLKAFIIDNSKPSSLISSVMLAFQVAANLGIPTYYFYTSSRSSLAAFLYLPTLHKSLDKSLKNLDDHMLVDILGLSPLRPCLGLARPTPWVLLDPGMGVLVFFFVG